MSLSLLILGEVIIVLLVLLLMAGLYIRTQKKLLQKQLESLRKIKELQEERVREYEIADRQPASAGPTLADYFYRNLQDSQSRYEKHTQATLPKIDPSQAFSAKVAALRFIYLTAEKEVYEERGLTHAGWNLFERKLADIVRWFGKPETRRQEVRSNRTRLLQERIDALKPFEEECKTLQRRLEQSRRRQKQLETFQRESRETISNLQKMIANLQAASREGISGSLFAPDNPEKQVDSMNQMSRRKAKMLQGLRDELNHHQSHIPQDVRQRMESSIKMMEMELIKSDQYIANLKKELNEAKGRSATQDYLDAAKSATHEQAERAKVMAEIHQLRENNRLQRELIVKLDSEIAALRDSLLTVEDEESRRAKEAEVVRLERLVRDCQNCIETLESQVDNLYMQLHERHVDALDTVEGEVFSDELVNGQSADEGDNTEGRAGEMANASEELEAMAKEMENIIFQYRQSHALNRLVQELFTQPDLAGVANCVVQFLNEFQVAAGFCLRSGLGGLEYFPDGLFDQNQKELMCSFAINEPVFYLDDTTLFSSGRINLMLVPSGEKMPHESVIAGLVKIVDGFIDRMESGGVDKQREEKMDAWVESTKTQLADLDIQYAYQLEENKKAFNHFMAELRQSYHLLDLKGSGLVLLDNAINEYEQRMYLIMNSGDVIDREITRIVDNIDQWQNQ